MYCNNGKFHEYITVGTNIYMTDHKHIGILGHKDYTQFGELETTSYVYGKNVNVVGYNNVLIDSQKSTAVRCEDGPIEIIAAKSLDMNSGITMNIKSDSSINIRAGSEMHVLSTNASEIKSFTKNVDINAKTYINLNAENGITVPESCYGTTLPSTGVEGQVFFKLIS